MHIDKLKLDKLKQDALNASNSAMTVYIDILEMQNDSESASKIQGIMTSGNMILFPNSNNKNNNMALSQNKTQIGESDQMPYLKEGTFRKRSDGRYEIRYYNLAGKQLSIYGKTQKDCLTKFDAALKRKAKGLPPKPNVIKKTAPIKSYTLSQWLTVWYETYKKPSSFGLSKSRLRSIEICIRLHIIPNLDIDIKKITGLDIQQALNRITSSKMRKETFDVYSEALRTAFKQKILKENPMDAVNSVTHTSVKGDPLTLGEQQKLFKNEQHCSYHNYFLFIIFSGVRPGEALLVKWENVNFKDKTILIPGTKTKASNRVLPLFEPLECLLKRLNQEDDYLFKISYRWAESAFKGLFPKHTLKDLRHTFATRCLENGVPMKVVQQWLGHTKYNTTANTYSHVLEEYSRQESQKLATIFNEYLSDFDPYFDP